MTPIKSIRAKCLECSCGNTAEVRNCLITECPLYPYRMGHRPKVEEIIEEGAESEEIVSYEGVSGEIEADVQEE